MIRVMGFFDVIRGRSPALLDQALSDMTDMLTIAHEMWSVASARLLDNDVLLVDLQQMDRDVNARERNVRRKVLEQFSLDPKRDMVFSLVLISIVQDAERVGDLAKSIAEVAAYAQAPRMGADVVRLRRCRDRVLSMLGATRDAFAQADEEKARQVMSDHALVKEELRLFLSDIVSREDLSANTAAVLSLGARMISRTSSHLSNIASSVALPFDQIRGDDESMIEKAAG